MIETDGNHFYLTVSPRCKVLLEDLKAEAVMRHIGFKHIPEFRCGRVEPSDVRDNPEIQAMAKMARKKVNDHLESIGDSVRMGENLISVEISVKNTGLRFFGYCTGGSGQERYQQFTATVWRNTIGQVRWGKFGVSCKTSN
jgi:hypothetical protein